MGVTETGLEGAPAGVRAESARGGGGGGCGRRQGQRGATPPERLFGSLKTHPSFPSSSSARHAPPSHAPPPAPAPVPPSFSGSGDVSNTKPLVTRLSLPSCPRTITCPRPPVTPHPLLDCARSCGAALISRSAGQTRGRGGGGGSRAARLHCVCPRSPGRDEDVHVAALCGLEGHGALPSDGEPARFRGRERQGARDHAPRAEHAPLGSGERPEHAGGGRGARRHSPRR